LKALECSPDRRMNGNADFVAFEYILLGGNMTVLLFMLITTFYDGLIAKDDQTVGNKIQYCLRALGTGVLDCISCCGLCSKTRKTDPEIESLPKKFTKGININRIILAADIQTNLKVVLSSEQLGSLLQNPKQLRAMCECATEVFCEWIHDFERIRHVEAAKQEHEDNIWPPASQNGIALWQQLMPYCITNMDSNSFQQQLSSAFAQNFTRCLMSVSEDDAMLVEERLERVGLKLSEPMILNGAMALKKELNRIIADSKKQICSHLDAEISSSIQHLFAKHTTHGEVISFEQLSLIVEKLLCLYVDYIVPPRNYHAVLESAGVSLQLHNKISIQAFENWFTSNFRPRTNALLKKEGAARSLGQAIQKRRADRKHHAQEKEDGSTSSSNVAATAESKQTEVLATRRITESDPQTPVESDPQTPVDAIAPQSARQGKYNQAQIVENQTDQSVADKLRLAAETATGDALIEARNESCTNSGQSSLARYDSDPKGSVSTAGLETTASAQDNPKKKRTRDLIKQAREKLKLRASQR